MLGDSLYLDNIEEYVQDEDKIVSQHVCLHYLLHAGYRYRVCSVHSTLAAVYITCTVI